MSNLSFQSSKKMVQKWYSRRKNKISQKVHKPCNPSKIKGCKYFNKNFSTQNLTLLIISVILQLEQRKGNRKEQRGKEVRCQRFREVSRHPRFQKITSKIKHREYRKRRDDLC